MHRPNFCSACGEKILRLHWYPWTSRRFCDSCSVRLRKERVLLPLVLGSALFCIGVVAGRSSRPAPPQLIIERAANSPLYDSKETAESDSGRSAVNESREVTSVTQSGSVPATETATESVYICGARTKKGTPCSRRVHAIGRCWQHKGMPAMLPPGKLVVKD
jgi:hypothetical protein